MGNGITKCIFSVAGHTYCGHTYVSRLLGVRVARWLAESDIDLAAKIDGYQANLGPSRPKGNASTDIY